MKVDHFRPEDQLGKNGVIYAVQINYSDGYVMFLYFRNELNVRSYGTGEEVAGFRIKNKNNANRN